MITMKLLYVRSITWGIYLSLSLESTYAWWRWTSVVPPVSLHSGRYSLWHSGHLQDKRRHRQSPRITQRCQCVEQKHQLYTKTGSTCVKTNLIKECVKYGGWQYLSWREIFTGLKSYIPDLILYNHLHECLHLHFEAKTIRFTWCNIYQCINEQRNKLFQEHISVKSF